MEQAEALFNTAGNVIDSRGAGHLAALRGELSEGLSLYLDMAGQILGESSIGLAGQGEDFFSLDKNFFSALFLYSYLKGNVPPARRLFYVAINQCLRGMVTGLDNILDDEYKKTLDYDLPGSAVRFRSVMDVMVSDRVAFALLLKLHESGQISLDQADAASRATLTALTASGAQEASEEGGVKIRTGADEVLREVHHYKTGLLFQAPWALPELLEDSDPAAISDIKKALYDIGIGLQIIDDMVDLGSDIVKERHNYAASLIAEIPGELARLNKLAARTGPENMGDIMLEFPEAMKRAGEKALDTLRGGLSSLFEPDHAELAEPSVSFLIGRLNAGRFFPRD